MTQKTDGVVNHLELDILECEIKWALSQWRWQNSRELFKVLKDAAAKGLYSMCCQIWKHNSDHRSGKGQFSLQRRTMPKNVQTIVQLCSFHILESLCSKTIKLCFSSMHTLNFQMYKLDLEKAKEPDRDQISKSCWIMEKAREFQKNVCFCSIDYTKAHMDHKKTVENS